MIFPVPLRSLGLLLLVRLLTAPAWSQTPPDLGGPQHARVAVVLFVATDCAISNRYAPEIQRLEREFAGRVPFWIVYPNATETPALIRDHEAAYHLAQTGPHGESHILTGLDLVHLTGAIVTPSSAVLVRDGQGWRDGHGWRPVYTGRIDDHYLSIGRERTLTSRHDLEDAVAATLAGRSAAAPGGPAVGCGIVEHK